MRCEDVQNELARNGLSPLVREAVESHVAGCKVCRSAQLLSAMIDDTLTRAPVWQPPDGFSRAVAAQAGTPAPTRPAAGSMLPPDVVHAVSLGVLAATGIYVGGHLVAWVVPLDALTGNAVRLAWTSVAGSLCVAAWFTRRALA
jgi:hypothetical protein